MESENNEILESVFGRLSRIQTSPHEEVKGEGARALTYLSWANAWALVKKVYPDACFRVITFAENGIRQDGGLPYQQTILGYMVWTEVRIKGCVQECYLPIMDARNKAKGAPDILDVNNALMRCLVKNLALFGLGIHIYAGEDIPLGMDVQIVVDPETGEIRSEGLASTGPPASSGAEPSKTFAAAIQRVTKMKDAELGNAKKMAPKLFQGTELEQYQAAINQRQSELNAEASKASASGLPI